MVGRGDGHFILFYLSIFFNNPFFFFLVGGFLLFFLPRILVMVRYNLR